MNKNIAGIGAILVALGIVITTPASAEASTASTALNFAKAQIGEPYVWGATGPNKWDCSGLTMKAFKFSKNSQRTAQQQYDSSKVKSIAAKYRKPGDLVFFGGTNSIYHVGIYVGWKYKGKAGGWIIHAPRTGQNVKIEKLWTKSVKYKRVK